MERTKNVVRKIYKPYQYLFYKYSSWDWYSWQNKNIRGASWTGLLTLSFLVWGNFLTISMISEIFTGYGFNDLKYLSKLEMIGIMYIFLLLNYLILVRNKKYKKIFEQFENEDRKTKIKGNIFASLFIVSTFVIGFYFMHLLKIFRPDE